ncbi:MAG TPA: TIGR03936 family radical SAM-associated protein [Bacillota bacterium]|nr:TIGR03936 family radical SAM-associated protein [Bacillota bacterium]
MQEIKPVRVFFQKINKACCFSHLDLNRAVARMLMRSALPVYFTEGFNPHAKVVFAVPLAIFQQSVYEIFDFALSEDVPYDEAFDSLSASSVPDLPIIRTAQPVRKLGDCRYGSYSITFDTDADPQSIRALFSGAVTVLKKTKKTCTETDISPQIKKLSVRESNGQTEVECVLDAAANLYLNPQYIVDHITKNVPHTERPLITRTGLYCEDMTLMI